MTAELKTYIDKARDKKLSDEQITNSLISTGWPADQVTAALGGTDLPVPPPPPTVAHVGMWTGFLYILFFISLYVLASSIGGIFDAWVDKVSPIPSNAADLNSFSSLDLSPFDLLNFYMGGSDTASIIRGCMAAIFVSYPLFVILAVTLKRQLMKNPLVKNLRSRKILIYITLIATFLIMLGEIIMTAYNFLAGSFTENAIKHVFVTFLIAGAIFAYFISEVKNDRHTT